MHAHMCVHMNVYCLYYLRTHAIIPIDVTQDVKNLSKWNVCMCAIISQSVLTNLFHLNRYTAQ